ncbi:MAG: STT3 domain-containing protein [Acidilobaceae archaeon]
MFEVLKKQRELLDRLLTVAREKWYVFSFLLLIALVAGGAYLRLLPAINYGLELDEADPFIMYYIAKHFHERGLFSFSELEKQDLFWYPIGRDLLRGEYIGVGWLAAATYRLISLTFDITLREWVALQPVIVYVLTCIIMYVLVLRLTGSHSGALVAVAFYSLIPSALSRTTVGFVEKMTIAFMPIALHYLLLYEALIAKSLIRSLAFAGLAGLVGGSVAFIWGGYHYVAVSLALVILLDFLVYESPSGKRALAYGIALGFMALAISVSPAVTLAYFVKGLGLAPLASFVMYLTVLAWKTLGLDEKLFPYTRLQHLWLMTSAVVLAVLMIYLGVLEVPGRILLALGIRGFSPLAESVSEHQPLGFQTVLLELGLPMFFVSIGLFHIARASYLRRGGPSEHVELVLNLMALMMIYASANMSYFLQTAVFYASLASGASVGVLIKAYLFPAEEVSTRRVKAKSSSPYSDLKLTITIAFTTLLILYLAYSAHVGYGVNSLRAPQILTSGLSPLAIGEKTVVPLNKAWIWTLEYLKYNTSRDDVIVSWWDYGYWISVDANRRTIADGSTWNETHIRLLANVLTGSEEEAVALMRLLGLQPNKTYLVFYEVFILYSEESGVLHYAFLLPNVRSDRTMYYVVHGLADFPKSFQMLKIAYRVDPGVQSFVETNYYSMTQGPRGTSYMFPGLAGSPANNVERVTSTLLYKLAMHGVAELPEKCFGRCDFLNKTSFTVPAVLDPATGAPHFIFVDPPQRFELEAVVLDVFYEVKQETHVERYAVLVFIYKWVERGSR